MYLVVLAVSIFIITIALSTIILPATLRRSLDNFLKKNWMWPVSAIRLMLGAAFLLSAEQCSEPMVINIMGGILIFAGISVPIMGRKRVHSMAKWWMEQKDWMIRIWGFAALLFGIFIALSGLPA